MVDRRRVRSQSRTRAVNCRSAIASVVGEEDLLERRLPTPTLRGGIDALQVADRRLLDQPAGTEDGDGGAERVDLGKDVRRQEGRLATVRGDADLVTERHLHERIEPRRGLVEQ